MCSRRSRKLVLRDFDQTAKFSRKLVLREVDSTATFGRTTRIAMPDLGVPEFWDNGMLVEKVGAPVGNHVFIAGIDAIYQ